jgi:hypothetical protein
MMVAIDGRKCRNAKTKLCAVPGNKISVYKEILVLYFQHPPLTSSLWQGVIFRALFSDTIMLCFSLGKTARISLRYKKQTKLQFDMYVIV